MTEDTVSKLVREKEIEQAACRDIIQTDWDEQITQLRRNKRQLEQEIIEDEKMLSDVNKRTGKRIGWIYWLNKAKQDYQTAWNTLLYNPASGDSWGDIVSDLRKKKRVISFAKEQIENHEQSIEDKKEKIKSIQSYINWAKDQKVTAKRIRVWSRMTSTGCTLGDKLDTVN
jgi:hypothetical protein